MYVIGIKKGMQLIGNKLNIQKTIYIYCFNKDSKTICPGK